MRSKLIALVLTASLAIPAVMLIAAEKKSKDKKITAAAEQLDERQRAAHALNRLTFGPRPGEVDRVAKIGVDKWIDQQLNPGKIDDRALEARLSSFRTLRMDSKELVQNFPPPQLLKQIASGKKGLPRDEERRAVYEAGVERYRARQEKKQEKGANDAQAPGDDAAQEMTLGEKQERQQMRREARDRADE